MPFKSYWCEMVATQVGNRPPWCNQGGINPDYAITFIELQRKDNVGS